MTGILSTFIPVSDRAQQFQYFDRHAILVWCNDFLARALDTFGPT